MNFVLKHFFEKISFQKHFIFDQYVLNRCSESKLSYF